MNDASQPVTTKRPKRQKYIYAPAPPGWRYPRIRVNPTIRAFLFKLFEAGWTYRGTDKKKLADMVNKKFAGKRVCSDLSATERNIHRWYYFWRKTQPENLKPWRKM